MREVDNDVIIEKPTPVQQPLSPPKKGGDELVPKTPPRDIQPKKD